MRFLLILFLLGLYVNLAPGRPSQKEENEKQTGDAEYDVGDIAEDYQENREPIENEPQQRSYDDREDSQNEEEIDDSYSEPNSEDPELKTNQQFSDVLKSKSISIQSSDRHQKDVSEELLPTKKDTNKIASYKEKTDTLEEGNINAPSEANEEDGNILFKDYPEKDKKEINNYHDDNEGAKQRFSMDKESYTRKQGHANEISEKKYENTYLSDRSRRDVETSTGVEGSDHKNVTNEKELGAIIENNDSVNKDIKELSRQELQDLISSLSINKINIVKQIINDNENISKRDLSKKAAANNEDSYSENGRSDIKQITAEGNAPEQTELCVPCPLPCPCPSPCPCPCPYPKPIFFNGSISTETELDVNQERSLKEHAKNEESGITESKIENDRQERELDSENISNLEGSYDISKNHDLNNYKETAETDHADDYSEFENFDRNILKREISKRGAPDGSIQSLEESFPNLNSNKNTNMNSDLEPLVRVKRTDKQDDLEEDSSLKVPSQSENSFDQQGGDTKDYEYIESEKQSGSDKNPIIGNGIVDSIRDRRERNRNQNNQDREIRNMNFETDNVSIGSDTDNVLTNSEKIGETITYDGKTRNKRMEGTVSSVSLNTCDRNLGYNREIADKIDNLETANNENGSSDTEADSFGLFSGHKDLNRFKRIRQVTEEVQNKEPHN